MKLDILKGNWIDLVFEGRNKSYGAYELRTANKKTNVKALLIGSFFFAFALAFPMIYNMLPEGETEEVEVDVIKITDIKLPPKEEIKEIKLNEPPPPPPPAVVEQVKFVKPVVAKTSEVKEDPPKIEEIKDKLIGTKNVKGDPDAEVRVVLAVDNGPKVNKVVEAEDTGVYSIAGIEVKPDFPGGIGKFYSFVGDNFRTPDEDGIKSGRIYVNFIVEKDGSLTDINVLRDIGYGTGAEAIRVLKKCPKWTPGIQNGKPVRVQYSLPITIQIEN